MIFIGIDNGVTGSIGFLGDRCEFESQYFAIPTKNALNYTKKQAFLRRIDTIALSVLLKRIVNTGSQEEVFCMIERPMINPMRWKASMSAMRALEATLIILEHWRIPYEYVDSGEWQSALLPKPAPVHKKVSKAKRRELQHQALKSMSLLVAQRLFPKFALSGFADADGLLIAEHCRRKHKR